MPWAQSTTKDYIRSNTNFTLSPRYSFHKPSYHKSCFLSPFIFRGHSTREPASGRNWFYSAGLHRSHVLATANTGKIRRFCKKCRWMDPRKKSLAVCVACIATYWPTPGFKGRTFKLCVLTRWYFNFCVYSFPLWDSSEYIVERLIFWSYQPLLWPWPWRQQKTKTKKLFFFTWHSGSWCCITIPSLVTKYSVVQNILSEQTFIVVLNLCCGLDFERSNLIFPQDTLAYDTILSDQVWLQTETD